METEITNGFPKITLSIAKIKIGEIINNKTFAHKQTYR